MKARQVTHCDDGDGRYWFVGVARLISEGCLSLRRYRSRRAELFERESNKGGFGIGGRLI